ncbi:MBG domain-containing protein [Pedobacter heparinus]|uniref:Filamentous hemagglutinin outer membrane protein n=1 Tax=Pedobacter heparinus (strain ATCC 13125 / DSM 2366 / CIP 104194 / JCM 7457 / NBRC 12017 / NCIMB 9290 / NRRL B-14731 / HIM 762-3) TaxID=485917 RepID=C6XUY1_PEDHD|nr:MBG domain-containing protein [Pedobacter heparinus]ACU05989.1 filamentous hemagglutinin outer membrane protein [Pedobacter heparinus DSM 2366]
MSYINFSSPLPTLSRYIIISFTFILCTLGFQAHAQYCTPNLNCTDGDLILNVSLSTLNNSSTCGTNGYSNFTALAAPSLAMGTSYPISVTVGAGWSSEAVSVWIDYNGNGIFEASEFTYIGAGSGSVVSGNIAIQATTLGSKRMRVRVAAVGAIAATDDMACDAMQEYGEFEDYTVNIVAATATPNGNGILHVKKNGAGNFNGNSWANAIPELADALKFAKIQNAIIPGTVKEIWVAKGTYKPMYSPEDGPDFGTDKGRDNAFLLVKDVKVYGGFAGTETTLSQRDLSVTTNKSTLSGDFNDDDVVTGTGSTLNISGNTENAYHVLVSAGGAGNAVLNGFTITGAYGASGTAIIVNTFSVYRNTGGGIINTNASSPTVANCIFINNMVKGGSGGAMYNSISANPLVMNCSFINNFASNISGQGWGDEGGGGMYNQGSAPVIVNCTFYGNLATGNRSGGAISNLQSIPSIINTVISNNSASASSGIYSPNMGTLFIRYSLVQDMPADVANHNLDGTVDPLFTNPATGDYTLKSGSPAINSGSNVLYEAADGNVGNNSLGLDKDLAGNPRLAGTNIDIGAYESQIQSQTITAGNIVKTYGDVAFVPTATASSGLEVSYASADNTIAEAFQDAADGNKWKLKIKKAGTVNITASQPGGNGYDPAPDVVFSLTVNKRPVTLSIKPAATFSKVYDAGTAGTFLATDLILASGDVINSDEVLLSLSSGAAQYDTKNAGTGKTITLPIASVSLSGAQAGNYSIANLADLSSSNAEITAMPLTITASNASKVYDGIAYAGGNGVSYGAFAAGESSADLSGLLSYGGTAQNAINAGSYTIIPGGLSSGNYAITYVNAELTISQNPVNTLTFNTQTAGSTLNKTYGDAGINAAANASSGLTVLYSSSNTAVASVNTAGQVSFLAAGTATITASQAGNANYAAGTAISFQVQVAKKILTVTAKDFNKTYDGLPYTGGNGVSYSGFENGDDFSALTGTIGYIGTSQGALNAGTYAIVPTGLTSANYDFDYRGGTLGITQSANNAIVFNSQTAGSTLNKTYGDAGINAAANASSGLTVLYSSSNTAVASVNTSGTVQLLSFGTAIITASQPGNINYVAATPVSFTVNVQKKQLSITAKNASKIYDGNIYTGGAGVIYDGFITGENESHLQGALTYSGTAQGAKNAGSYFISPAGYTSSNYAISYQDGNLSIAKASLNVTAAAKSKTYGDDDPVFNYNATGLIGTDGLTGSLTRAAGNNATTYAITQGTLTAGNNYTIVYTPANLTIGKAQLMVTAEDKQMCQGAALPAFTVSYSGFKYNDGPASLNAAQLNSTGNQSSEAGNYVISASGATAANYTFNYVNGTLKINPMPVLTVNSDKGSTISKGEIVQLTVTGAMNYSWTANSSILDGQQTGLLRVRPKETTTYTVTGTNASGCSQRISFTLTVLDDLEKIKANNILTPNNDGYNDKWVVDNIDFYPDNTVKVFDRSGRVVYAKKGYDNSWEGTLNGTALAEGTYYYIIDFGINKRPFKGYITLIREN